MAIEWTTTAQGHFEFAITPGAFCDRNGNINDGPALFIGTSDGDGSIIEAHTPGELTRKLRAIADAIDNAHPPGTERPDPEPADPSDGSHAYTVVGVWLADQPVPVGVIAGEHPVTGGAADHFDEGLWATFVTAADPDTAEQLAISEMKEW